MIIIIGDFHELAVARSGSSIDSSRTLSCTVFTICNPPLASTELIIGSSSRSHPLNRSLDVDVLEPMFVETVFSEPRLIDFDLDLDLDLDPETPSV